jgi:hypothetical protein
MKWTMQPVFWKVALILGALASFLVAAGADTKWT